MQVKYRSLKSEENNTICIFSQYQYYIKFQLLAFENGKVLICGNNKKICLIRKEKN
jgi:hypothetical protein